MKFQLNIRAVALKRGISNPYQLQIRAALSPSNASRLFNHEVSQISLETLGKLCEALDCKPNNLFKKVRVRSPRKRSPRIKPKTIAEILKEESLEIRDRLLAKYDKSYVSLSKTSPGRLRTK